MVVHTHPGSDTFLLAFEVSDPHTKELLAKHVDPSQTTRAWAGYAETAMAALRPILLELFDPDPF